MCIWIIKFFTILIPKFAKLGILCRILQKYNVPPLSKSSVKSIQSIILHQLQGDQLFSKCVFMCLAYISEILRSFRFLCISGQEGSLSLWLNFIFTEKEDGQEKKTELCKQLILLYCLTSLATIDLPVPLKCSVNWLYRWSMSNISIGDEKNAQLKVL